MGKIPQEQLDLPLRVMYDERKNNRRRNSLETVHQTFCRRSRLHAFLHSGEYSTVESNSYYRWDNVDMTEAEYEAKKNEAFDQSTASKLDDLKNFDEICDEIKNY